MHNQLQRVHLFLSTDIGVLGSGEFNHPDRGEFDGKFRSMLLTFLRWFLFKTAHWLTQILYLSRGKNTLSSPHIVYVTCAVASTIFLIWRMSSASIGSQDASITGCRYHHITAKKEFLASLWNCETGFSFYGAVNFGSKSYRQHRRG